MQNVEPIRVLNLFTIMNRGGAETMVMNYYRGIDRNKVQFDFMVHREERGAYDDEIEYLGGKIYRMPPIRPWTARTYRNEIKEFYLEHQEYKIIHSHMSELGYYDFIESMHASVPVRICHAHNRPYGIDIKSPVRWYYKNAMLPYTTDYFTCGEESAEWLFGKKNINKCVKMNNAIDASQYIYDVQIRNRVRRELGINDNQIVVGHVGRFNKQKNHRFLIDIFEQIHKIEPNSILLLVGDDSSTDGRVIHDVIDNKGFKHNVKFLGTIADVSQILQAMDVFLFPSLFEGLSVASVEAQAAGLPIIISDKVPIECKITDLVHVLSLSQSTQVWAKEAIRLASQSRKSNYNEIIDAGYDIKENARWLQDFYLSAIER